MRWFRFILCVACIIFHASEARSQNLVEEVRLWDKAQSHQEGRFRSKLFVYQSVAATNSSPAIIILPGGSYTYLAVNSEGHDVARYFASKGYVAVVLRYRMGLFGARYPQQLEDYRKAMDYLKANCSRLGIDTARIGVAGFSAGGHLAGCAAMEKEKRYRPAFVAMIYPVVTMREPYCHHPSKNHLLRGRVSLEGDLSLEEHVDSSLPPVFLLCCEDDPTVRTEGSHAFASELEEKGVTCKLEFHPSGGHGFGVRAPSRSGAFNWQERFTEWLENTVFE